MQIDTDYLLQTLLRLLSTPSPAGDTERGTELCRELFCAIDDTFDVRVTRKGVLTATWPGLRHDEPRAVSAHIDTIGAVVKSFRPNGRILMQEIGSLPWTAVENEGVTLQTLYGPLRGSVVVQAASYHVHKDDSVEDAKRSDKTMEIRLDARIHNADDLKELGIHVGDSVYFDTRTEVNNGFIRSRYLDDKACVACLFAAAQAIHQSGTPLMQRTTFHIPNYEEVCHGGASGVPEDVAEFLAVDVAPTGLEQNSDEFSCTLCLADVDGPYDAKLNRKLQGLARQNGIELKPDVFPRFSSDAKALWKAGADVRCSLIGPGVHATHSYERTTLEALETTARLIAIYLTGE